MNYMNTQNMNYAFNNPDMYNMNNFYYSQNANNANANNSNVNIINYNTYFSNGNYRKNNSLRSIIFKKIRLNL